MHLLNLFLIAFCCLNLCRGPREFISWSVFVVIASTFWISGAWLNTNIFVTFLLYGITGFSLAYFYFSQEARKYTERYIKARDGFFEQRGLVKYELPCEMEDSYNFHMRASLGNYSGKSPHICHFAQWLLIFVWPICFFILFLRSLIENGESFLVKIINYIDNVDVLKVFSDINERESSRIKDTEFKHTKCGSDK